MKKNRQYYKSKRRVLKYKDPTQATINAMRIAFEAIMLAMQLQIALQTPRPKFPHGVVIRERSPELITKTE